MLPVPAEPLDVLATLLRPYSNQKICMVVSFSQRLNRSRLRQALQSLRDQNPILGCRLFVRRGGASWVATSAISTVSRVIEGREGESDSLIRKIVGSYGHCDAPITTDIVRQSGSDTLIVCIDHTITDAVGAKELCYQLADNYSRLAAGTAPANRAGNHSPRNLGQVFAELNARQIIRALGRARIPTAKWRFPVQPDSGDHGVYYVTRHTASGLVAAIRRRFTNSKITVNDILLATFLNTPGMREISPFGRPMPVQFMVDLRRYLPGSSPRPIANLSSVEHMCLTLSGSDRLDELIRRAHCALARIKSRDPGIGTAILSGLALRYGINRVRKVLANSMTAARGSGLANPILSNFGVIDAQRLAFGSTDIAHAYMTGPGLYTPGIMLVASTYRDRLTLSAGTGISPVGAEYLQRIIGAMCTDLQALAGSKNQRQPCRLSHPETAGASAG